LSHDFQIGEPTILINNAGVAQGKLLIDLSPEDIQQYVNALSDILVHSIDFSQIEHLE